VKPVIPSDHMHVIALCWGTIYRTSRLGLEFFNSVMTSKPKNKNIDVYYNLVKSSVFWDIIPCSP
jgi:hypothetical protein